MLEVKNLEVRYGNIVAVRDMSLVIDDGQAVCLVGSNGAGKTTTMSTISGLLKPAAGQILLDGEDITGLPPHVIARKGLIPVPEGRHIFAKLTVNENLIMGAFSLTDRKTQNENFEKAMELFPELKTRLKQYGGTLSGGEQQMLAIGRALMANPKILLLDEPSMGLAPIVVNRIFDAIRKIKSEGVTIFLVEQNAKKALGIADFGYVVERGEIVLKDTGANLMVNEDVAKAYLGGGVRKNV